MDTPLHPARECRFVPRLPMVGYIHFLGRNEVQRNVMLDKTSEVFDDRPAQKVHVLVAS